MFGFYQLLFLAVFIGSSFQLSCHQCENSRGNCVTTTCPEEFSDPACFTILVGTNQRKVPSGCGERDVCDTFRRDIQVDIDVWKKASPEKLQKLKEENLQLQKDNPDVPLTVQDVESYRCTQCNTNLCNRPSR